MTFKDFERDMYAAYYILSYDTKAVICGEFEGKYYYLCKSLDGVKLVRLMLKCASEGVELD